MASRAARLAILFVALSTLANGQVRDFALEHPRVPMDFWSDEGVLTQQWTCSGDSDHDEPEIVLTKANGRRTLTLSPELKAAIGAVDRWAGEYVRVEYTPDRSEVRTISRVPEWLCPPNFRRLRDFRAKGANDRSPGPDRRGAHPYVFILAKFADRAGEPAPRSYYDNLKGDAFPALNNYYTSISYQSMSIDGSVVIGWVTLPKNYADYLDANNRLDFTKVLTDATAVVDSQVDFRNFYGINVCVNDSIGGGIWGLGGGIGLTLDGENRVWGATLNGPTHDQSLLVHEMGHSLGLRHFSSSSAEYGSPYCPMGSGNRQGSTFGSEAKGYQTFQRWWLNWLPEDRVYYAWPGTTQTIRLEKRTDPSANGYLMARVFYGGYASRYMTFETVKGAPDSHDSPALARYVVISDIVEGQNPKVVDANPGSGGDTDALAIGATYEDLTRGVRARVIAENETGIDVELSISASVRLADVILNTNDSGPNSLREALIFANQFPSLYPKFNIPTSDPNYSGGVFTIKPTLSFPEISGNGVVVNGLTQQAFTGNTNSNGPEVMIDGSLTGGYVSGLVVSGANNIIRGLGFQKNTASGVYVYTANAVNNTIDRCTIGVTADGMTAAKCGWDGITVAGGAKGTLIGGTTSAAANLISANGRQIAIWDPGSDNTLVQNNFIGGNRTGLAAFADGGSGIGALNGPKGTKILSNRSSGNQGAGIEIWGAGTDGSIVRGNRIGVNATGNGPLPNTSAGIVISADGAGAEGPRNTTIGGKTATERNVISGNDREGIWVGHPGTTGLTISGNWVGIGSNGTAAVKNTLAGIAVTDAKSVKIGGITYDEGNLVGNNTDRGISLWRVTDAFVQGNRVGYTQTSASAGNTGTGIELSECIRPRVGGTVDGTRNFCGNNGGAGIAFWHTSDGFIQGNKIGLTPSGLVAAKNNGDGILLATGSARNMVGGTIPTAVNVIGQCGGKGIAIWDADSDGNKVYGNWIGFATDATTNMPIDGEGIFIGNEAKGNIVGGQPLSYRNVVGNTTNGAIYLWKTNDNLIYGNWIGFKPAGAPAPCAAGGVLLVDTAANNRIINNIIGNVAHNGVLLDNASNNTIQGNLIGIAYGAETAAPIRERCVTLYNGSSNNLIGGTVSGQGNRLGNAQRGLELWGAHSNTVQGNYFGLTKSNLAAGFTNEVILIENAATNNWIGGAVVAARNVITGGRIGVAIGNAGSIGNRIRLNSIFSNAELGINLWGNDGAFGVTPNDAGDADTGPNGLSNFPVITAVQTLSSTLSISGSISGKPSTTYTIDLFASTNVDPSSYGEGQVYLGTTSVTTNGAGTGSFNAVVTRLGGIYISATATDSAGNTSEFGPAFVRT